MNRTKGKVELHDKAVSSARIRFNEAGLSVQIMPRTNSPFDLLVGGKARVEVKVARLPQKVSPPCSDGISWNFNLHRHGEIESGAVDFYVAYLPPMKALGLKYGFALIIPALEWEGKYTIHITFKTLVAKWGKYWGQWDQVKRFCANGSGTETP